MIEVLTVMGIIVILMAILLPVVSSVRRKGFETDTNAELGRLGAACHNYYQDHLAYPGPIPETMVYGYGWPTVVSLGTPIFFEILPPLSSGGKQQSFPESSITSSENLVLGLAGGFGPPLPLVTSNPTLPTYDPTQVSIGPRNLSAVSPKQWPAYYDPGKYELPNDGIGHVISKASTALTGQTFVVPEFMDHFPVPNVVIYLRAGLAGIGWWTPRSSPPRRMFLPAPVHSIFPLK